MLLVLLLMLALCPAAAGAVSWDVLMRGMLRSGTGSYEQDGTTISREGSVTRISGGTVEFGYDERGGIASAGTYIFDGVHVDKLMFISGRVSVQETEIVIEETCDVNSVHVAAMNRNRVHVINRSDSVKWIGVSSEGCSEVFIESEPMLNKLDIFLTDQGYVGGSAKAREIDIGVMFDKGETPKLTERGAAAFAQSLDFRCNGYTQIRLMELTESNDEGDFYEDAIAYRVMSWEGKPHVYGGKKHPIFELSEVIEEPLTQEDIPEALRRMPMAD